MSNLGPSLRSALVVVIVVAVAVAAFHHMFGISLASARAGYWIEPRGDMATMMAGYEAVQHAPWRWPLAVTELMRPYPVSIVYSDSLPWMALALKATGLAGVFNPLGLFLLISYVLQVISTAALLRACGVRRAWPLIAGCLLALLIPAWLARQFGHIALAGHWLLIFSLALSISSARAGLTPGRVAGFALLSFAAVGIHPYHLPPIAACFGAAVLSEILQGRRAALLRSAVASVVVLIATGCAAYVLGYGVGQGLSGGGGALGVYSMNLAGPFLPQASALAGQRWNGTWFTGTLEIGDAAQAFEGFNYLGGGVLLLLAAGLALWIRAGPQGSWTAAGAGLRRFGPLVAALVFLTLMAIGPRAYAGPWLAYDLGRPTGVIAEWLGLFRAHGRLFWTAAYGLLAGAIVLVDRLAPSRLMAALLTLAVGLQAFDVSQLTHGVRTIFEKPAPALYDEVLRTSPAFEKRPWRFYPLVDCISGPDAWALLQLTALAIHRHGSSNSGALARAQTDRCGPPPDALRTAAVGDNRITVVVGASAESRPLLDRFRDRTDCFHFRPGLICARGLAEVPGLRPTTDLDSDAWRVVRAIAFNRGTRPSILGPGWSLAEPGGIWTDGASAELSLGPDALDAPPQALELEAFAFMPPGRTEQRVEVRIGDEVVARWRVVDGAYRLLLPPRTSASGPLRLVLHLPDAISPVQSIPGNPDVRKLGIGVREVRLLSRQRAPSPP